MEYTDSHGDRQDENSLELVGYAVLTAANVREVREIYGRCRDEISLVILDLVMPEMGGKEAFKRFKQVDPDVNVLLCSGYTADGQAACILKDGCKGFIQKPFTINQLSQKLHEVFQHR